MKLVRRPKGRIDFLLAYVNKLNSCMGNLASNKPPFRAPKKYKENFYNKPNCQLINPAKNNLGRVSNLFYCITN